MLEIITDENIHFKVDDMPATIPEKIKAMLTLPNPAYLKALKYGRGVTRIPKEILLYKEKSGYLTIPRGVGNDIIRMLIESHIPYQFHDNRLTLSKVHFHSKIRLRDYQKSAVEKLLNVSQGFLVSPCGSGKTVMMIELMARISQPTLFIVHQKELMDQIIHTAVSLTDVQRAEIGIIGSGKRTIGKRVTVATIQTLNRMNLDEIKALFGAVFVDEAHHLAAKSFYEVISRFPAKYRLAVSATPERADGLSEMVYACSGPVIHEITQSEVPTIIPELRVIRTEFDSEAAEHMDIMKELIEDKARNRLIVRTIAAEAAGNYSLVLSDRVEHLNILKPLIKAALPRLSVEILTGELNKKDRKAVMERAKNKEIDILLATQLAREGLDIPHLNRLFMIFPKKSQSTVQQECGRIMRPAEEKRDAVVFDFYDVKHGILHSQFKKRQAVYRKIGMKIESEAWV